MRNIFLYTAMIFLGVSCSKDNDNDVTYSNQGTIDNPVLIEAEKKYTGTVSGDPESGDPSSSYYVFTAPEDGYYSIIMENIAVATDIGASNHKYLAVNMAHISDPSELGGFTINTNVVNPVPVNFNFRVWKGEKYVVTVTNQNTNYTDGTSSKSYPKQFELKVYKHENITGSINTPIGVGFMQHDGFSSVGECYFKYFGFDTTFTYCVQSDDFFSAFGGIPVENVKIEIFKNNFQQENKLKTIDGKSNVVTFDLKDFTLPADTAFLHIYSPDNKYWGYWYIKYKW